MTLLRQLACLCKDEPFVLIILLVILGLFIWFIYTFNQVYPELRKTCPRAEAFILAILSVIINFIHPVGADPLYKTKREILNQLKILSIGIVGFIILAILFIVILKLLIP